MAVELSYLITITTLHRSNVSNALHRSNVSNALHRSNVSNALPRSNVSNALHKLNVRVDPVRVDPVRLLYLPEFYLRFRSNPWLQHWRSQESFLR